jgi:hypothetical protein
MFARGTSVVGGTQQARSAARISRTRIDMIFRRLQRR